MSKMKVGEYFNPDQHLTFHQDKDGNMIGGGYQVNNLLYQHKTPLFVSLGDGGGTQSMTGGGGGGSGAIGGEGRDESENRHFIPEKFSDLFRDLAVPAGLFMMPAQFKPRNYAFEVPDRDTETNTKRHVDHTDGDGDTDTDTDDEGRTKTVPNDIFDTLLSLVTPTERIQHDVKTRRKRQSSLPDENKSLERKRRNKTRRAKAGIME
jgi:hypothetical protein